MDIAILHYFLKINRSGIYPTSKKIAVFFGSSLIVWTSVFVITLLGLMVGYRLGGNLSLKKDLDKILFKVLFGTLLYYAITLLLTNAILSNFVHFSLIVGSVLSCLILLFPMFLLFGLVSPILIKLLSKDESEIGKNTGFIYTISTLGGVCLSLISGLYLIPDFGLKKVEVIYIYKRDVNIHHIMVLQFVVDQIIIGVGFGRKF